MNISQIKKAIPVLMKHKIVPYLHGSQGVGKTQVIGQIAKSMNLPVIHLHLATQEVGDLVGLLVRGENNTVFHARPEWFPVDGKGIIFLDEFNRAPPEVLQAMLPFTLTGRIHTHELPKGWSIIAAGNYQSNAFNTTDMSDAALYSRFCHIDFLPTREEFVLFAEDRNAFSIADFIRSHPEMLEVAPKERLKMEMITPDRRSWVDFIAPLELEDSIEEIRYDIYSGIVGNVAAAAFMTHKVKEADRLKGRDILNQYSKVQDRVLAVAEQKEIRFDLLNSAVEEIFLIAEKEELKTSQIENFKQFLLDMPNELSLKVVDRLSKVLVKWKNEILNSVDFAEKYKKIKLSEKERGMLKKSCK